MQEPKEVTWSTENFCFLPFLSVVVVIGKFCWATSPPYQKTQHTLLHPIRHIIQTSGENLPSPIFCSHIYQVICLYAPLFILRGFLFVTHTENTLLHIRNQWYMIKIERNTDWVDFGIRVLRALQHDRRTTGQTACVTPRVDLVGEREMKRVCISR